MPNSEQFYIAWPIVLVGDSGQTDLDLGLLQVEPHNSDMWSVL